jgi:Zn-dependent protease
MPGDAIVWYLVFVVSTTAHEASHALAAYVGGDRTAYLGGQVSLNPLPHMKREPFGMVIMPLLGVFSYGWPIGWASTPYDPRWEQRYPRRAAWMAAAGPAANLLLALLALILLRLGLATGIFAAPELLSFSRLVVADTFLLQICGRLLSMLLTLNVILLLFNLIPFPPLDGASVLVLVLPEDMGIRLRETLRGGGFAIGGLLLAWYLFAQVIGPVWALLLRLVHPDLVYG